MPDVLHSGMRVPLTTSTPVVEPELPPARRRNSTVGSDRFSDSESLLASRTPACVVGRVFWRKDRTDTGFRKSMEVEVALLLSFVLSETLELVPRVSREAFGFRAGLNYDRRL
ncbi:hypothetical protein MPTK1_5g02410 [Marchantia polymorpha subsp. ruderalis]|uniref:Uncharacterized protein n=2 Tax=Marchantia polymorpha TaxID=3197 RepID=A0AAF6BE62_MARPO|nr:hypothetical protein MARPO_0147s0034 [Marchantia polymorpha]BBN10296.1 hypothetical protein Mp_5g02410 [Marchantia polymorpha subsp. ruderalis]|eukprot:PTQ29157.1 hypothetical protein MARPO_0147s0034 [Marchantia polymorpha]